MPRTINSLKDRIYEAKLKVMELEEAYRTQLYLETMPAYDPMYKYCYSTSSMSIPYEYQSPVAWIRAVIKHMSMRRPGHGGAYIPALVIETLPPKRGVSHKRWLDYYSKKIAKLAKLA